MAHPERSAFLRYGVAVVATAVAVLWRLGMDPYWGTQMPFITFYLAVMIAGWFGGLGPGLLASALSGIAAWYLWLPPRFSLRIASLEQATALVIFVGTAAIICVLNALVQRARRRDEQASERMRGLNQELDRERRLLRAIIERIPAMVAMYEPDSRVLHLNPEFERVTGWSTESAREIDLMERCYPDPAYREEVRQYMESLAEGWRDIRMMTRDGRVVDTVWSNVQLDDNTRVGIGLDVTERKRIEHERELARAVAEAANRAKDEFLAMLGHELRNPLNAINSAVTLLHDIGGQSEQAIRVRAVIGRQVRHLTEIVDDLLDVARVTTGKIVLAPQILDLGEVVKRALATLADAGRLARHAVEQDIEPVWVNADDTRIEQILTNLVSNSLKFTPAGGAIRVTVRADGNDAMLRVEDTGAGIAREMLPRVFDLFVQGERTLERSQGGLGLGLTLVRRLVELHGGRVEAASEGIGHGAAFTVRLRRTLPPVMATPERPKARASAHSRRVLLVEDNTDGREMLRMMLELQGHQVYEAADGLAGIDQAIAVRPDVAIIDIGLPGMDGYEVARQIRENLEPGSVRLIALTGYGREEDRRRAWEAGFNAHLVKPVEPERLTQVL